MSKYSPKVSIIIPVYNGSNYMRDAIDSALAQDYENFEVIVVNDGSRDEGATDRIARSYGDRIRYFLKKNGGVATALNYGIEKMTGEYVSWLSHDDMYLPYKLSSQVALIPETGRETAIIYSGVDSVNAKGVLLLNEAIDERIPRHREHLPLLAVFSSLLNGCAMLIPKAMFERYGSFDTTLRTTQDYDLWFRFLSQPDVRLIPCYLNGVKSRKHEAQGTYTMPEMSPESVALWKAIIDKTQQEQRIAAYGSEYAFLNVLERHLRNDLFLPSAADYANELKAGFESDEIKREQNTAISVILHVPQGTTASMTEKTLRSIQTQTHPAAEILPVGDRPINHDGGCVRNFSGSLNDAVSRAQGEVIAFAVAGDEWGSERVGKMLETMFRTGCDAVSDIQTFHHNGYVISAQLARDIFAVPLQTMIFRRSFAIPFCSGIADAAAAAWFAFKISLESRFVFSPDTGSLIQPVKPDIQDLSGIMSVASTELKGPRDRTLLIDVLHGLEVRLRATLPVQHTYFQQEKSDKEKIAQLYAEVERQQVRYSN